ncbi:MAG: hypothetical protein JNM76_16965 [Betaproteobacteria bacterium]|nr:hypothetical protein [Betaproteobacteria bacterium]
MNMKEGLPPHWPLEVAEFVTALAAELAHARAVRLITELDRDAVNEDFALTSTLSIAAIIGHPRHGLALAVSSSLAKPMNKFVELQVGLFNGASVTSSAWSVVERELAALRHAAVDLEFTDLTVCDAVIAATECDAAGVVRHLKVLPPDALYRLGFASMSQYREWMADLVQGVGRGLRTSAPGQLLLELLQDK